MFPLQDSPERRNAPLVTYFLLYPWARLVVVIPILFYPLLVEVPAALFGALWFLMQIYGGLAASLVPDASGGIAWWAHIAGFVAGMLLLPFFLRRYPRTPLESVQYPEEFWP